MYVHREMEIRAAEKRLLQNDIPRTGDEFEKLVRGSPNSSFAWIQYMAYCIDMAEIEKARSVAERLLHLPFIFDFSNIYFFSTHLIQAILSLFL